MRFFAIIGILGVVTFSTAQETTLGRIPEKNTNPASGTIPAMTDLPITALPAGVDTFATYVFTTQNLILFAYEDSTVLQVLNKSGSIVWSGTLNINQCQTYYAGAGVFLVRSNKKYSILVGDPLRQDCYGWYAVDQNNRAVSTKLLTYFTPNVMSGSEFIVFAYEDSTVVNVYDNASGSVIMSGTIDSAKVLRSIGSTNRPVRVEASKGVSALTYSDQGYWVPSRNGTFAGQLFYAWIGNVGPWTNDLNVCAYNDETHVKVTRTNDKSVIWEGNLDEGEVHTVSSPNTLVTVQTDKNVTCLIAPFVSYSGSYYRLYVGMDGSGEGIGTKFYHPTISGAQLYIFSFYNNNNVKIYDQRSKSLVWSGKLDAGGYKQMVTSNTVYRIISDRGIAMYDAWGDIAGADFAPLWFAVHPEVAVLPDQEKTTEAAVPVKFTAFIENNGNYYDIVDILHVDTDSTNFTSIVTNDTGGPFLDGNGNGIPDTDTLEKGGSFAIMADVTPSDTVPFGTADSLLLIAISYQDTTKCDTTFMVTYIRRVDIKLDSNTLVNVYPGDTAVISVNASNTSRYREDTVSLKWQATKPSNWPVKLTDITGSELFDSDGDGLPDVSGVLPNEILQPFQVRIGVPDSAKAGERDTVYLIGTSANYPLRIYPTATDTIMLIVNVLPAPAIRIRPSYSDSVESGQTIRYPLEVSNWGNGPDVPNIYPVVSSRLDWGHQVISSNTGNPITDTDGDGKPDVGTLPGLVGSTPGSDSIYLDVTPPRSAPDGQIDSTIIYAYSAIYDTVYDSTIVVTKALFPLVVRIDIEPDSRSVIGPGDSAIYPLTVVNHGTDPDTIDIGTYSLPDLGWSYNLTFANGAALKDDNDNDTTDLGKVDSSQIINLNLIVKPTNQLGQILGNFDTSVVETRYVWIQTGYRRDTLVRDSVKITTVFEPVMDIHNYPNPFSGTTTFAFSIPRAGQVSLKIYNRAGEHIRTLIDNEPYAMGGMFNCFWDGLTTEGKHPAPGVYLYTLEWTPDEDAGLIKTRRIVKKALMQP